MPKSNTLSPASCKQDALAVEGGSPAKTRPYGTGARFGEAERRYLDEALAQGSLFYAGGEKTRALCERFAARMGVAHAVACSSGSAALHTALGAIGIQPGDEVITSPITDMGTCTAILLCGGIPVFADIDPRTFMLDAASVAQCVSARTKAVIAVHLAGAPCDLAPLMETCRAHGLRLIEDCAQAWLSEYRRQLCGTVGDVGCFSLNDFKHIGCGDGGLVLTADPELARRAALFADKCYDRARGSAPLNPWMIAPNYRITELQAAVALAQLEKLDDLVAARRRYGDGLVRGLSEIPGIRPQQVDRESRSSYWFLPCRIDEQILGPRGAFAEALAAEGLNARAGYLERPVYLYDVFTQRRGFGGSEFPFNLAPRIRYEPGLCPSAEQALAACVRFPVSEWFNEQDLAETLQGVRKVALHFQHRHASR